MSRIIGGALAPGATRTYQYRPDGSIAGWTDIIPHNRGGGAESVIKQLQAKQDEANAANEARYQQLLELAQRFGQSMLADNAMLTQQQMASAGSNLASRGLGNSTIVNAIQGGIQRQGQMQANRIQDLLLNNQMGIIERRTDQHPNLGLLAQLLMQPGALGR